jgi:hypothetical protein
MTSQPTGAAAVDPEAEYFQSIEECFVERRGDPLLLSNADWLLIRRWRRAGIPLRVVLRGIRDAFDGHAHSWGRNRKVASLKYCEREVASARERWHRAIDLGAGEERGVGQPLADLAQRFREAQALPVGLAEVCLQLAEQLEERARAGGELAGIERWLEEREKALVRAIRKVDGAARVAEVEAEIDAGLAPYRDRMPPAVVEQVRTEALARALLERCRLPRLSLFHMG